jgi:hypothetical protein
MTTRKKKTRRTRTASRRSSESPIPTNSQMSTEACQAPYQIRTTAPLPAGFQRTPE